MYRCWWRVYTHQHVVVTTIVIFTIILYYTRSIVPKQGNVTFSHEKNEKQIKRHKFSFPLNKRQIAVRNAMQHAWRGYKKYAWGYDELNSISKTPSTWFGLGLTIIDGIDTLYIMNMIEEYKEARQWIEKSFDMNSDSADNLSSHFEITIRILGGLLSIYHLTGDELFLKRSIELGDRLLLNFNTPSGLPLSRINLKRNISSANLRTQLSVTAEVGTVQIEMRDLSRASGDRKYEEAADRSAETLHNQLKMNGLVPILVNTTTGKFSGGYVTFGGCGDSYYEYLLKQWIQTGQTRFFDDWIEAVGGVRKYIWQMAYPDEIYFIGDMKDMSKFIPKMGHLACFLPANLALGWYFEQKLTYLLDMAKELTETCYEMYAQQPTGLSPETVYFNTNPESNATTISVMKDDAKNLLRPELIESLYYMYHITGDEIYQQWGWKIFQSFEKYTRQKYGYSSIEDVRNTDNVRPLDRMESYFLAETLKYFYLLFNTKNLFPFDQWLFNTEAHPLPIYNN